MSMLSRQDRGTDSITNGSATPYIHNRDSSRASILCATSPTSSHSPTVTSANQTKLNVVTRIAIEGKSQPSAKETGAEIKMYLKIALPLESVTPGMTIPLFPEDNVRITMTQVHPLDQQSVPYSFSTTHHPLLHKAARALNLPAPSSTPYLSVFGGVRHDTPSPMEKSSRAGPSTLSYSDEAAPIDANYAGHILVSGYQICYILPKEFPPLQESRRHSYRNHTPYKNRRSSLGEKHVLQFMAAIQMYVPFITMPPRNPYLLSIPTPRCLQNSIKFRIVSSKPVSTSLASLSSIEEDAEWDFSADPIVTPKRASRLTRTNSHSTDFADDESSDSSVTDKLVSSSQGTFQSTERIRIRWAKRSKSIAHVEDRHDGWNRIGVDKVKGEMRCIVLGKRKSSERQDGREGIIMKVEYSGTCTGLWFPGVATLVGMDVGLEAKGSDVSWVDGYDKQWTVSGGHGFTGFNVSGPRRLKPTPTKSSLASTHAVEDSSPYSSRRESSASASSLLRAPLPNQSVPEYSFESSAGLTPSTLSSIGSLTPSSRANTASSIENLPQEEDGDHKPPGSPITVHVNMNEFVPPARNSFTFSVSGVCLVIPRHSHHTTRDRDYASSSSNTESESDTSSDPVVILPRFTVLAANAETTTTIIENKVEYDGLKLVVFNPSGDISRDAQALKTVLQRGGSTTCSDEGGRISLRSTIRQDMNGYTDPSARGHTRAAANRSSTPAGKLNGSTGLVPSRAASSKPKRDGPLLIPSVTATVTPLLLERTGSGSIPLDAYAVRVSLPVPADPDCEFLEFGLAQIGSIPGVPSSDAGRPPNIEVASASIEGIPVRCEITIPKQDKNSSPQFEQLSGQEWLSWAIVHIAGYSGGMLAVDYIVRQTLNDQSHEAKWKGKAKDETLVDVFLPVFFLPIGRLEVLLDNVPGFEIVSLRSNLAYQQSICSGRRLLHFSLDTSYLPQISVRIRPDYANTLFSSAPSLTAILRFLATSALLAFSLITLFGVFSLGTEVGQMRRSLETYSLMMNPDLCQLPEPVTVTTTVYASSPIGSKWRFNGSPYGDNMSITATAPTTSIPDTTSTPESLLRTDHSRPVIIERLSEDVDAEDSHGHDDATTSLLPAYPNFINWPISLENVDAHVVLDKVLETLDVIWQVLRKIYHYPLPPP